jgi:hypothetical protein
MINYSLAIGHLIPGNSRSDYAQLHKVSDSNCCNGAAMEMSTMFKARHRHSTVVSYRAGGL